MDCKNRLKLHNLQNGEPVLKKFWGNFLTTLNRSASSMLCCFSRAKTDLPRQSDGNLRKKFCGTKGKLNFRNLAKTQHTDLFQQNPLSKVEQPTQTRSDNVQQTLEEVSAVENRAGKRKLFGERLANKRWKFLDLGENPGSDEFVVYFSIFGEFFSKTDFPKLSLPNTFNTLQPKDAESTTHVPFQT